MRRNGQRSFVVFCLHVCLVAFEESVIAVVCSGRL